MALLGVILLVAGIGAGVVAYVSTRAATSTMTVTAFGFSREATPFELVLYGAIAMLLVALGWALLSASARRRVRARRTEREDARVAELEDRAESDRLDHERRFEEAGLRDEDLRRRESEIAARHEGLDQREAELDRREAEWRDRDGVDNDGPTRADVVTGRAEGRVSDGTARWSDNTRDESLDREDTREDTRYDTGDETRHDTGTEPPARPAETRDRRHDHDVPRQNG